MRPIVTDVSPESLLAASHEHFASYVLDCAAVSGGEVSDSPQLAWGISGTLSPWMNSVVRTRLDAGTDVDDVIESVIRRAEQRSVPMGWFLLPGTTPSDIGSRLVAHGLVYEEDEPGMAVDLGELPDSVPTPDGFRLVEVLDLPTLRQWVETWGASYGVSGVKRKGHFDFRVRRGLDAESFHRSFLGYVDDQPVATSELFLGGGVAAVVWVGTVPSARRRGLGSAMTLAPLLEARKLGYRIGALTSSAMGYSAYEQLGFREYCRTPVYIWSPDR